MKQFTLKAGEIVKINGIPIALVEDAIFETNESNMSVIFQLKTNRIKVMSKVVPLRPKRTQPKPAFTPTRRAA